MKKILILLLIAIFPFASCEKDDICDANTSTTPRLVIDFYDALNPTVLKNVTNLKVIGEGIPDGVVFTSGTTTSANKISIPLKTTETSTSFKFILNSGNALFVNEDNIKFNYTHEDVFVSRACGYKTIFNLTPTNPYTLTDAAVPDVLWIKSISVIKNNIENENETHIKIFF